MPCHSGAPGLSKDLLISMTLNLIRRKNWPHSSGDDIAGIVHSVGKDVFEFKPGDRVVALHQFQESHGSFADYAIAPDTTTFHIPPNVSFEEAATVPLAALTAAVALFVDMKFPAPYDSRSNHQGKVPFVIYGITSAVGAFAASFARISGPNGSEGPWQIMLSITAKVITL